MFASIFLQWIFISATFILVLIYWYFKSSYGFWKQKGIKYVKPIFPYGTIKDIFHGNTSLSEYYKEIYDSYPEDRYIGMFEFSTPILLIKDPTLLKNVFVKDFQHFQKRGPHIFEEMDPLTLNLLYMSGSKWQNIRSKLTPTFTSGKMKIMFQLMLEVAAQLAETLNSAAKNGEMLEFKGIMLSYSMELIGSCIFGLQFNAIKDPNSDFRKMDKKRRTEQQEYFLWKKMIRLHFPSVARFLNLKFLSDDVTSFFISSVKDTMAYREKNNVSRNDFLQLLMELKSKGEFDFDEKDDNCNGPDSKNKFYTSQYRNGTCSYTKAECYMAAQAFSFLVAGFDTSSSALSCCLYELAVNPEIQDKLRESIKSTLKEHDGKITYDAVQEMSYLSKVVDETLRKYPPGGFTIRIVTKPYIIPGTSIKLEVGSHIRIPILGLHHDPKYYPDPDKFNPENFTEEAIAARPQYTFLPFGEGPRYCIGMRFGLLQVKLGIINLLLNYEFMTCEKTNIPLKLDPKEVLVSADVWLKINKIKPE